LAVRADHAIVDLTGRRVREVGDLRWHELDLDHKVWHLPGAGAKNEKNCDIPLSDQVVAIIQSLPRLDDVLVFPGGERRQGNAKPPQDYWSFKVRLAQALPPWSLGS